MAGLRYSVAFLILLPFLARSRQTPLPRSPRVWFRLALIGVSAYTIGNGALFWALQYLSATTTSFMMSFLPLVILFAGVVWLREIPTFWQAIGVVVALVGSLLFFSPGFQSGEPLGLAVMAVGQVGFLSFSILGREMARDRQVGILTLTAIPLGFGGGISLLIALLVEGLPAFSAAGCGIVLWLAVVNTAFAYILYNHSLQVLTALEMNMVLNVAPLGTAALAWALLGEKLSLIQAGGMITVIIGAALVQWRGQDATDAASEGSQQ